MSDRRAAALPPAGARTRGGGRRPARARDDRSPGLWRRSGRQLGRPLAHVRGLVAVGGDQPSWDRDEWDVALNDGAVYRIFRDRDTDRWFIDAIAD